MADSEDEWDRALREVEGWAAVNQPGAPKGQWSASPMEHVTGTLGTAWDALKKAAHWAPLAPAAKRFSDWLTTPELDDSWLTATAKGFVGGATEGLAEQVNPMNVALTASGMKGAGTGLHALGRGANLLMAGMGAEDIGRGIANEEGLSPADQIARIGGGMFALGMGGAFGARPAPFQPSTPAERATDALNALALRSEMMRPTPVPPKPPGWTPGSRPSAAPPGVTAPGHPPAAPLPQAPTVATPTAGPGPTPTLPKTFSELSAAMTDALARGDTAALARLNAAAEQLEQLRTRGSPVTEEALDTGPTLADAWELLARARSGRPRPDIAAEFPDLAITQTSAPQVAAAPGPPKAIVEAKPIALGRAKRPSFLMGEQPGLAFLPDEPAPTPFASLEAQAMGPIQPHPAPTPEPVAPPAVPSPVSAPAPAEGGVGFRAIQAPFTGARAADYQGFSDLVDQLAATMRGRDLWQLANDPAAIAQIERILATGRAKHGAPASDMLRMAQALTRGETPVNIEPPRSSLDALIARTRQTSPYDPTYWRGIATGSTSPQPGPAAQPQPRPVRQATPKTLGELLGKAEEPTTEGVITPQSGAQPSVPPAHRQPSEPEDLRLFRSSPAAGGRVGGPRMLPGWSELEPIPRAPTRLPEPARAAEPERTEPTTDVSRQPQQSEGMPEGVGRSDVYETTDPDIFKLDPETYQIKKSDARGVVLKGGLEGATEWEHSNDPILVHQRTDGSLYVVDGHQRFNLYKRLKAEGKALPPLRFQIVREVDGDTVEVVRRAAALHNIGAGSTDPVDVAKVLREGPLTPLERARLPKGAANERTAKWQKGERLSRLSDGAWRMVVDEKVNPDLANYVVNHLTDEAEQIAAFKLLNRSRVKSEPEADAFFAAVKAHGFKGAGESAQGDLFGAIQEQIPVFEEAAKLQQDVIKELSTRRSAFSAAVRHAERLTEAGNVLDQDINIAQMNDAARARAVFLKYAHLSGTHTRRAINEAAPKLADGTISRQQAIDDILAALQRDIDEIPTGSAGTPAPEGEAGRGPRHEDSGPAPEGPITPASEPEASAPTSQEATPDEVQRVLDDMAKALSEQPTLADESDLFGLSPQDAPSEVSRRELESQHGQRRLDDVREEGPKTEPRPEPKLPPETPPEAAPVEPRHPGPGPRRPPQDQAPAAPPGGTPWEEHPNGWAVAPPNRDFIAVKLPRLGSEGKAIPAIREAIRALGGNYRKKFEQWFIDVNDVTREPTMERVREILRRNIEETPTEGEAPAAGPPRSLDELLNRPPARPVEDTTGRPGSSTTTPTQPVAEPGTQSGSTWDQLKPNQRSYLTQQAKLTREQIDAMSYDEVVEYGRRHGERVRRAREEAAARRKEQQEHPPEPIPRESLPREAKEYLDFLQAHLGGEPPVDGRAVMSIMEKYPNFFRGRMRAIERAAERRAKLMAIGRKTQRAIEAAGLVEHETTYTPHGANTGESQATPAGKAKAYIRPEGGEPPELPPLTEQQINEAVELGKLVDRWQQMAREQTPRPGMRQMAAEASRRAELIAKGDPASLEEYADLLKQLQDREYAIQVRNKYSTAKAGPPARRGPDGEFIGCDVFGFGSLAELYRKNPDHFWYVLRAAGILSGAKIGAEEDTESPLRGAILGAVLGAVGTNRKMYQRATLQQMQKRAQAIVTLKTVARKGEMPALRMARDLTRDIGWTEWLLPFSVERTVPDVFKKVQPILDQLNTLVDTTDFPVALRRAAVRTAHREAAEIVRAEAKVAADAGLKRKAAYLGELAQALAGRPTGLGLQAKKFLQAAGLKNADTRWIERHVGRHVYRVLTGYALDSALMNLTQPILALRFVSPRDLIWGYRMRRTQAGKAMTRHVHIHRPVDMEIDLAGNPPKRPVEELGGLEGFLKDPQRPLWVTDNINRETVYLAAYHRASQRGLNPAAADEWASAVMRATQGHIGPLAFNPHWRGPIGGSLKPFMKFPGLLTESLIDTLSQPDVAGRGRLLLALLGAGLAGRVLGLDFEAALLMGGRPFFGLDLAHPEEALKKVASGDIFPVVRGVKALAAHTPLGAPAKSRFLVPRSVEQEGFGALKKPASLLEDLLATDVGRFTAGRFPTKLMTTAMRFGREGVTPRQIPSPSGAPTVVSALEDAANLAGIRSTRQTALAKIYDEARRMSLNEEQARKTAISVLKADLSRALARGNYGEVSSILAEMVTVGQSPLTPKSALTAASLERFERMARSASPRMRAKMYEVLGEQVRQLQPPR